MPPSFGVLPLWGDSASIASRGINYKNMGFMVWCLESLLLAGATLLQSVGGTYSGHLDYSSCSSGTVSRREGEERELMMGERK